MMARPSVQPPRRYLIRESLKYPIVRAGWRLGIDWRSRFVPSTLTGLTLALKEIGWSPTTCVDVGVAWGTVELQRGFPRARHVLIEPNPLFADFLREQARRNGWEFHQHAASDQPGSLEFAQISHQGGRVVAEGEDLSAYGPTITVPCTTLDELDRLAPFGDNLLIKIDVEGHEREVLAGAESVLQRAEVVVVETQPLGRCTSSEIVALLLGADLHLTGFLTPWVESRRRRILAMVDLVFMRRGGQCLETGLTRSRPSAAPAGRSTG